MGKSKDPRIPLNLVEIDRSILDYTLRAAASAITSQILPEDLRAGREEELDLSLNAHSEAVTELHRAVRLLLKAIQVADDMRAGRMDEGEPLDALTD